MKTLLPFLTPTVSPTSTASHTIPVTPSGTDNDTPYRHLLLFGYIWLFEWRNSQPKRRRFQYGVSLSVPEGVTWMVWEAMLVLVALSEKEEKKSGREKQMRREKSFHIYISRIESPLESIDGGSWDLKIINSFGKEFEGDVEIFRWRESCIKDCLTLVS
ncbi:hypothetical protein QJS04_geneDACA022983 [Acorus gramineus]|uniref:Uncharacterized protein n=1 Tax=Acorus gramineus TaxID=55184 RepID=A0AAV9BN08_ACOGR|nr:hypothetical protein QJS04_geneDACA022983 [Acorus gramineus]